MTIGQELDAALQALQPIPGPPGPPGTSPTVDLSGLQAQIDSLTGRITQAEKDIAAGPKITPADLQSMFAQMVADVATLSPTDLAAMAAEAQALQKALLPQPPPPVDNAPVWKAVPTMTFVQGTKGSIPITSFVSDPDFDPLTIRMNGGLPSGCTFDGANINYDGVGLIGHSANTMTADDGKP